MLQSNILNPDKKKERGNYFLAVGIVTTWQISERGELLTRGYPFVLNLQGTMIHKGGGGIYHSLRSRLKTLRHLAWIMCMCSVLWGVQEDYTEGFVMKALGETLE